MEYIIFGCLFVCFAIFSCKSYAFKLHLGSVLKPRPGTESHSHERLGEKGVKRLTTGSERAALPQRSPPMARLLPGGVSGLFKRGWDQEPLCLWLIGRPGLVTTL